jgi:hypothetical protein
MRISKIILLAVSRVITAMVLVGAVIPKDILNEHPMLYILQAVCAGVVWAQGDLIAKGIDHD